MDGERRCIYCNAAVHPSLDRCPRCRKSLLLNGRYRLEEQLGEGGSSVVCAAADTIMHNRRCAIKRVIADADHEIGIFIEKASRFAFIPHSYDRWSEPPYAFHVMEYIGGKTLADERPLPWPVEDVAAFLRIVLGYLVDLHADGLIHRDLKPANIKHTPHGRAEYMLLDFGIARRIGDPTSPNLKAASRYFAPPEQWFGEATDERADLYNLAATTYLLLTGRFARETYNFDHDPLVPPGQLVRDVPPALEQVVLWMLQLRPDDRPPSARAALAALDAPGAAIAPAALPAPLLQPPTPHMMIEPTVPVPHPAHPAPHVQLGNGSVVGVGWASDGRALVVAATLNVVIYESQTLHEQRRIELDALLQPGMFAHHADRFVVATGKIVQVRRVSDGTLLQTLRSQLAEVVRVALTPDGGIVALASHDDVQIWRGEAPLPPLQGHIDGVTSLAVTPDGAALATASRVGVQLWRLHDGALIGSVPVDGQVTALAYAPDSQALAVAAGTSVSVYRTSDRTLLYTLAGHTTPIVDLAYAPNGLTLASASDDMIQLWRAHNGTLRRALAGDVAELVGVRFAPDGQTLAVATGESVRLWSAGDGTLLRTLRGYMSSVQSVAFAPDGQTLAAASSAVQIWRANAGTLLHTLEGQPAPANSLAFSPDGQLLAAASRTAITLWRTSDWTLLRTLDGRIDQSGGLVFAADSRMLIVATSDAVQVWDAGDGTLRATLNIDMAGLYAVALGPDGQTLAAVYDRAIQLWRVGEGAPFCRLETEGDINGVALAWDGVTLAAALDEAIEVWRARDGDEDRLWRLDSRAQRVVFAHDGALLAAAWNTTAQVWDVSSGVLLCSFEGHRDSINDLAFAPDGRLLASASQDGTLRLWDIGRADPSRQA